MLHQNYPDGLAVIAWHNGDEFEFPEGMVRDNYYAVTGYPTVWFDGETDVIGGGTNMYPYYEPVYNARINTPSNFVVDMTIDLVDGTDYSVTATIDIVNGNSTENLAGFVVLTETDLVSPGSENQNFTARNVYPDGMGLPLDFSTQTSHTWTTVVTVEDEYVLENCELIVFIQNMDTKEIYQGTSLMGDNWVGISAIQEEQNLLIYPNPATDRVNIKADSEINHLMVYNHFGQLVLDQTADTKILNINTSNLESGLYMFKIQTADGTLVKSVIIK